ncbi:phosphoribosylanthranilate isomerase [Maricaulis salignorans]|uniref:N-(5'-phosphoribosyl)anthranilate isomerase n=1 Tax=Maricaulis salignorans TaxID=144026 RepID=A0A1G9SRU4_9PROT|nr:phosphoribosylanthranilate isomerase [Maricaulis salignorans]SDM38189.1 phosphoribosylanthranilate isomerase [Maricaulis salignorans]
MTEIKFCGLKTGRDVAAAVQAGARWTGYVIFPASPRHVTPALAGELAHLAQGTETVAVMVDPDDALLAQIRDAMRPDWIQLHGSEDPRRVVQARAYARQGIIKSVPVADASDLEAARAYDRVADMLLFDAKPPRGASRPGGWGETYDYGLLKNLNLSVPWLLSGGLDASNVAAAVAASGAKAVDVSSGIESSPGIKDAARIQAFADALAQPAPGLT